jgi:hypothetical protein
MSENFLSYYSNLKNWVPFIPVELCKLLVNRARRDIYSSRLWSFLIVESQLTSPPLISAGSATFTQYGSTVTGDAIASAAWTGLSNPLLTQRQLRQSGGPIYNIIAADFTNPAAVVLTLDRPYQEPSGAGLVYQMYQCYYPPTDPTTNAPTADFVKWLSVYDPINGYPLKLNYTQQWLNSADPKRGNMGQPYRVVTYKDIADSNGDPTPFFELWPHPTDGVSRKCFYLKGALDFRAPTDALPSELPVELLEVRARYRAYEWAEANKGNHPNLQKTNWMAMRVELMNPRDRSSYPYLLRKAQTEDENRMPINFVKFLESGWRFPIDSNFLQSHAWSWELPGESVY